ncbi:MAG: basic amino acid ABC transporter substrate-binding protein [Clostridia bacterium]|nr:basic amino acid ABC transporter substrate-binding protein [Clostridia bacterium]
MKKILALILTLALVLPTVALADTIVMGSNCSFPPFEYIDEQGNPAGFDVEIGKLVAEKLGVDFYLEDMNFDGLLLALEAGKVDFVIAAMTITEARQEQVNFSTPYFDAQQVVVVQKGYDGIQTYEDIKDKAVSVQDGTTGFLMATEDVGIPAEEVVAFKMANDAVAELKLGRVDCMILDSAPALVFVSQNDDLEILEGIETPAEQYGIAVKKGNDELLAAINELLAEIMADGTYDALIAKFFQ